MQFNGRARSHDSQMLGPGRVLGGRCTSGCEANQANTPAQALVAALLAGKEQVAAARSNRSTVGIHSTGVCGRTEGQVRSPFRQGVIKGSMRVTIVSSVTRITSAWVRRCTGNEQ